MYLRVPIFFSICLAVIIMMMEPIIDDIIAFEIIAGCMFKGLNLFNDIHNRLGPLLIFNHKVKNAYEIY